jgi:hypothetical protein
MPSMPCNKNLYNTFYHQSVKTRRALMWAGAVGGPRHTQNLDGRKRLRKYVDNVNLSKILSVLATCALKIFKCLL